MQGVNRFNPLPDPTGKPNKLETNNTENASTEVQMFNYKEGYDAIVGEVARNDGGYNLKELDGDPDEMVTQLENLRNKYKGRIPEKLEKDIQAKISELHMQKLGHDLIYSEKYNNLTDRGIENTMKNKINGLKTPNDCKNLAMYLKGLRDDYIDYGGVDKESINVIKYCNLAIPLVYDKYEELDPSFNRFEV